MKDREAKIIYSRYWFKNLKFDPYPTIYIDEYWDYTIDAFNLREDWEWFLSRFNKEFSSAREYIEDANRVIDAITKDYFAPNIAEILNNYKQEERHFKNLSIYNIPDGEYLAIDLKCGGYQCLKYIGALSKDMDCEDFIKTITTSTLLQTSKLLKIQATYAIDTPFLDVIYNICDTLMYKVSQSLGIDINDVIGIHGDCIYIPVDKLSLTEGDCVVDGISVHILKQPVKSLIYKGQRINYQDSDKIHFFHKNPYQILAVDEYLSVLKCIKDQQPNQMDLTVGLEDQIFYVMD